MFNNSINQCWIQLVHMNVINGVRSGVIHAGQEPSSRTAGRSVAEVLQHHTSCSGSMGTAAALSMLDTVQMGGTVVLGYLTAGARVDSFRIFHHRAIDQKE